MKAQMEKLIDVNDLIERLDTNNVPYCGKIKNIIATMPKVTMYKCKADDYPENGNGYFGFEIELLEHQANVMSEYLHTLEVREVRAEIENVEL